MFEDDSRVYVVSGAGGVGSPCNGEYRRVRELNDKPLQLGLGDEFMGCHDGLKLLMLPSEYIGLF